MNKMKKKFNVYRIFKKIQCVEKILSQGYQIKSNFAKLERIPLSNNKRRRLEIDKDYLVRQLGKFIYVSEFHGQNNGPAIRAIIEDIDPLNVVYISKFTGKMTI